MTTPARCYGGTHVTPNGASSCCCGDVTRVPAPKPPAGIQTDTDGTQRWTTAEGLHVTVWQAAPLGHRIDWCWAVMRTAGVVDLVRAEDYGVGSTRRQAARLNAMRRYPPAPEPPADGALREQLLQVLADVDGEDVDMLRLRQDPKLWDYERAADAALTVLAAHLAQQQRSDGRHCDMCLHVTSGQELDLYDDGDAQ